MAKIKHIAIVTMDAKTCRILHQSIRYEGFEYLKKGRNVSYRWLYKCGFAAQ